jgi:hypothetical protein
VLALSFGQMEMLIDFHLLKFDVQFAVGSSIATRIISNMVVG